MVNGVSPASITLHDPFDQSIPNPSLLSANLSSQATNKPPVWVWLVLLPRQSLSYLPLSADHFSDKLLRVFLLLPTISRLNLFTELVVGGWRP